MTSSTPNTAPALRLPEPRSEFPGSARALACCVARPRGTPERPNIFHTPEFSNASLNTGDALLVHSPLTGERVRVRGGSARGLSHFESATTFPPIIPALSPSRGEGEKASRGTATLLASSVLHFPDVMPAVASQPRSSPEQNECPSTASSRSDARRCSTWLSGKHRVPRRLCCVQGIHAGLRRVQDCSVPQHSKSLGSGHRFHADDEICTQRSGGHGASARFSSQPTWIFSAGLGEGLWTWSDLVGGTSGDCKSLLTAPPLTLTLSPLRGEGTRDAWEVRKWFASSFRLNTVIASTLRLRSHLETNF
jgi:hypothetical protein